jgi:hypothetical protein
LFIDEAARPSGDRAPVESFALARFANNCFSLIGFLIGSVMMNRLSKGVRPVAGLFDVAAGTAPASFPRFTHPSWTTIAYKCRRVNCKGKKICDSTGILPFLGRNTPVAVTRIVMIGRNRAKLLPYMSEWLLAERERVTLRGFQGRREAAPDQVDRHRSGQGLSASDGFGDTLRWAG